MTTYTYTGESQTINLAAGRYKFECYGAQGGGVGTGSGGKGGYCSGIFTFATNTTLYAFIGNQPSGITGGFNGGGNGDNAFGGDDGYGGGGATDIRVGGTALTDRIIVAAGGGGTGVTWSLASFGGAGGGLSGQNGGEGSSGYGTGATQSAGGSLDGASGIGGNANPYRWSAGGGGGGFFGGGGSSGALGGGGGGSSYYGTAESPETTSGVNEGNGYIVITELGSEQNIQAYAFIM